MFPALCETNPEKQRASENQAVTATQKSDPNGQIRQELQISELGSPLRALRLLYLLHQWWNDIKQVSHHGDVRDLEDRGFGILIHRDDGACALHANHVLDSSADTQSEIELGSDRLPRGTNLPVHRQPAGIAYWS